LSHSIAAPSTPSSLMAATPEAVRAVFADLEGMDPRAARSYLMTSGCVETSSSWIAS
jgi:hypothetical protein